MRRKPSTSSSSFIRLLTTDGRVRSSAAAWVKLRRCATLTKVLSLLRSRSAAVNERVVSMGRNRSVRRQPVQDLETPPDEIAADRDPQRDLDQLHDQFVFRHGHPPAHRSARVLAGRVPLVNRAKARARRGIANSTPAARRPPGPPAPTVLNPRGFGTAGASGGYWGERAPAAAGSARGLS